MLTSIKLIGSHNHRHEANRYAHDAASMSTSNSKLPVDMFEPFMASMYLKTNQNSDISKVDRQ